MLTTLEHMPVLVPARCRRRRCSRRSSRRLSKGTMTTTSPKQQGQVRCLCRSVFLPFFALVCALEF